MLPIHELITAKPRPALTPSLVPSLQGHAAEMVETYIFTDTIRGYFEQICDTIARGQGQGFWVEAEYGAGKTHFLVTLAALLSASDDQIRQSVRDDVIRVALRRLKNSRLFPVVLSLRGEGSGDTTTERSLFEVLLEDGFQSAIETAGLDHQVQVTAAEDVIAWLDEKATQAVRDDIAAFVRQRSNRSITDYHRDEGINTLAALLREYFKHASFQPNIAIAVKDRLAHIYRQITDLRGPAYTGVLIVIDEYEGWEKSHNTDRELSRDADLLETLSFVLTRDLGLQVYTIVASQSAVPTKLRGSQQGDRFIRLPLLAGRNERDYDVIISRRARGLNEERLPEINQIFRYYQDHFAFARDLDQPTFHDIFPFQPRCFEAIRRITARDLPTARSGLMVFWQTVNDAALLKQSTLIRLADMLRSEHLERDCLAQPVYKDARQAYGNAFEVLPELEGLEEEDLPLARDVLTTLYLWYLAFLEQPRRVSLRDLAEATLTTDGVLRADDSVRYVLNAMQALPQIEFKGDEAGFVPAGAGYDPRTVFNEYKRRAQRDPYRLISTWSNSLFWTPRETGGIKGIFSDLARDTSVPRRVQSRSLEYTGEVLVSGGWRLDHGTALPKNDIHFRLIILTPENTVNVKASDLYDPRIAVVQPGEMTEDAREAAAACLAWQTLRDEVSNQTGREAEETRSWLDSQKQRFFNDLYATQLKLYQAGKIVTCDNLGINMRDAFGLGGGTDRQIEFVVDLLLRSVYSALPLDTDQFRSVLTATEAGKVFEGYFNPQSRTAGTTATRSYGVGLGLSHKDAPDRFAPQNPQTFELIEGLFAERGGNDLPIWQIYDRLSSSPYGLPYVVIQLYLLAFVRYRNPRVDITLKNRSALRQRGNQPFARDRLTVSSVIDLDWKPRLEEKFDLLVRSSGPTWDETLAYARIIVDDLRSTSDQVDIEAQSRRLIAELKRLNEDISTLRRALNVLTVTLNAALPQQATTAIQKLAQLTEHAPETFADFYELAESIFASSHEAMRDNMQTMARLRTLADDAAEIGQVRRYLNDVALRPDDERLAADRATLLGQMTLDALAEAPELWRRLRNDFEQFRQRYRNEYQKHHRDYYAAMSSLRGSLAEVPRRLNALALINQVESIGAPVGIDLARHYQTIDQRLKPCSVREVAQVNVDLRCPNPTHGRCCAIWKLR